MSDRDKMLQVQTLVKEQHYSEARAILATINHPKAREWELRMDKLGMIEKPKRGSTPMPAPTYSPQPVIQVNVQQAAVPIVIKDKDEGPGCLTQFLWFVFVGWWASQIAIIAGYLLIISVLLMPLGVMIINRIPGIVALRGSRKEMSVKHVNGVVTVSREHKKQRAFLLRAVYFLLFGWWFSAFVLELAWLFSITVIGIPLAFMLFDFAPKAISLRR